MLSRACSAGPANRLPNAFAGTALAERSANIQRTTGRGSLILVGFMTQMSISATACAALDHGIAATVVASATATRDLPGPFGGVVDARTVQETALAEIADRFAAMVPDKASVMGRAARLQCSNLQSMARL